MNRADVELDCRIAQHYKNGACSCCTSFVHSAVSWIILAEMSGVSRVVTFADTEVSSATRHV
jgi:hypothetical protein